MAKFQDWYKEYYYFSWSRGKEIKSFLLFVNLGERVVKSGERVVNNLGGRVDYQ
jgi:hypothetical protein